MTKQERFIARYKAMRREKRFNEIQHGRAIGYINKLIDRLRKAGVTEQL